MTPFQPNPYRSTRYGYESISEPYHLSPALVVVKAALRLVEELGREVRLPAGCTTQETLPTMAFHLGWYGRAVAVDMRQHQELCLIAEALKTDHEAELRPDELRAIAALLAAR